jgi:hypothetical protein
MQSSQNTYKGPVEGIATRSLAVALTLLFILACFKVKTGENEFDRGCATECYIADAQLPTVAPRCDQLRPVRQVLRTSVSRRANMASFDSSAIGTQSPGRQLNSVTHASKSHATEVKLPPVSGSIGLWL